VFHSGPSLPFHHSIMSTTPPIYFEDPLLANKGDTKSISPPYDIHFINKNKEFKEANTPTLTSSIKPTIQACS